MKILKNLSDEELIRLYREEDSTAASDVLCRRYAQEINLLLLYKVKDPYEREELFQDLFFHLLVKLKTSYREEGHFKAWLQRLVSNYITSYYRMKNREMIRVDCDMSRFPCLKSEIGHCLEMEYVLSIEEKIIDRLSPLQKEIIQKRYYENKKRMQVSEEMGVTDNTSRKRIQRLLKKMKGEMENEGITKIPD